MVTYQYNGTVIAFPIFFIDSLDQGLLNLQLTFYIVTTSAIIMLPVTKLGLAWCNICVMLCHPGTNAASIALCVL
jgi:hypothetical protein